MRRVALVSCGQAKVAGPVLAADLYTSTLFRLSLAWARANADVVYILSAKHELLALDIIVERYDLSLASFTPHELARWADRVIGELYARETEPFELVMLAGDLYAAPIRQHIAVEEPLRGMPLFKRLRWLSRDLNARRAA